MRRDGFRDALRRAAEIIGDRDLVVIGSQSIHGSFGPGVLPPAAVLSREVDILPFDDVEGDKTWLLAGRGGDWGGLVEIDGVDITTSTLPAGWVDRLIPFPLDDRADAAIGWCLDPHDLVVAKVVAGRTKDHRFVAALVEARLIDPKICLQRLASTDPGCRRTSAQELEQAGLFLLSLPRPDRRFPPGRRRSPKGRAAPDRSRFVVPVDMWADLRGADGEEADGPS